MNIIVGPMQPVAGVESLAVGSQLIVSRRGYRHYGIYVGGGRVVHYAGRIRYPHGLIEDVPLADFAANRPVRVGDAPGERREAEDVVRRARSRLGERRYDLLQNNCEHFCSWCQNGEARSAQVDALSRMQRLLVHLIETVLLAGASWYRRSRWLRASPLLHARATLGWVDPDTCEGCSA